MNRRAGPGEPDEINCDEYDDEPDEPGMSLLELRYRRVLRLLPAAYRAEREDEMVDTYLECTTGGAGSDDLRPTLSEVASVAALAVRVRLGGVGAAPRVFAWGEAVRLAAVCALFGFAVGSVLTVYPTLRLHGLLGAPPDLGVEHEMQVGQRGSPRLLWESLAAVLALAWLPAFVALVRGYRRAAKVCTLLAFAVWPANLVIELVMVAGYPGAWQMVLVSYLPSLALGLVLVLALFAGFHREAPPVSAGGSWLAALGAAGAVSLLVALLAGDGLYDAFVWLDGGGLESLLLIPAALAYAGVHLLAPARRGPSWPLALAILTAPVLALRLAAAVRYSEQLGPEGVVLTAVARAEAAGLAALGLVLLLLASRSLRGLPSRLSGAANGFPTAGNGRTDIGTSA